MNTHELRFTSLFDPGRAFCFPCDSTGAIDLDSLPEKALNNLRRAQSSIGIDLAIPAVFPVLPIFAKPLK